MGEITEDYGRPVTADGVPDKITLRYFVIVLYFAPLLPYGTYLIAVG